MKQRNRAIAEADECERGSRAYEAVSPARSGGTRRGRESGGEWWWLVSMMPRSGVLD